MATYKVIEVIEGPSTSRPSPKAGAHMLHVGSDTYEVSFSNGTEWLNTRDYYQVNTEAEMAAITDIYRDRVRVVETETVYEFMEDGKLIHPLDGHISVQSVRGVNDIWWAVDGKWAVYRWIQYHLMSSSSSSQSSASSFSSSSMSSVSSSSGSSLSSKSSSSSSISSASSDSSISSSLSSASSVSSSSSSLADSSSSESTSSTSLSSASSESESSMSESSLSESSVSSPSSAGISISSESSGSESSGSESSGGSAS